MMPRVIGVGLIVSLKPEISNWNLDIRVAWQTVTSCFDHPLTNAGLGVHGLNRNNDVPFFNAPVKYLIK